MSKTTSFRHESEDITEYLEDLVDNKSEYLNTLIKRDMQTRGLTRREKLESELAEIRDEKRKVSRRLDDLDDDEQRVQSELEQYTGKLDTRISEVVDGLHWITRVHPELRRGVQIRIET